jgi:hypothetical protein
MNPSNHFHEANRASEVLSKIGKGAADADFARAIHQAIDRSQETMKKSKVTVTVEIDPDEDRGCLRLRAEVSAKLPKLPAPASQMHVGAGGELLTQQEWMFGGGRDEQPLSVPKPIPASSNSASGRLTVAKAPTPGPVAASPTPAPVVGKDAAAGKEA